MSAHMLVVGEGRACEGCLPAYVWRVGWSLPACVEVGRCLYACMESGEAPACICVEGGEVPACMCGGWGGACMHVWKVGTCLPAYLWRVGRCLYAYVWRVGRCLHACVEGGEVPACMCRGWGRACMHVRKVGTCLHAGGEVPVCMCGGWGGACMLVWSGGGGEGVSPTPHMSLPSFPSTPGSWPHVLSPLPWCPSGAQCRRRLPRLHQRRGPTCLGVCACMCLAWV